VRALLAALRCEKGDIDGNRAAHRRLLGVQRKRYLGEGEEAFTAGATTGVFGLAGACFGVVICAEAGSDEPFDGAVAAGAGLMLFPAAPGLHGRRTDEASWQRGFAAQKTSASSEVHMTIRVRSPRNRSRANSTGRPVRV
jgi:predicted amidohydrolase